MMRVIDVASPLKLVWIGDGSWVLEERCILIRSNHVSVRVSPCKYTEADPSNGVQDRRTLWPHSPPQTLLLLPGSALLKPCFCFGPPQTLLLLPGSANSHWGEASHTSELQGNGEIYRQIREKLDSRLKLLVTVVRVELGCSKRNSVYLQMCKIEGKDAGRNVWVKCSTK